RPQTRQPSTFRFPPESRKSSYVPCPTSVRCRNVRPTRSTSRRATPFRPSVARFTAATSRSAPSTRSIPCCARSVSGSPGSAGGGGRAAESSFFFHLTPRAPFAFVGRPRWGDGGAVEPLDPPRLDLFRRRLGRRVVIKKPGLRLRDMTIGQRADD